MGNTDELDTGNRVMEPDLECNPDPFYDANGAARYLGLVGVVRHPAQAIRALCRKRRIRSTKVAGKVMIRRSWLEKYIANNARDAL